MLEIDDEGALEPIRAYLGFVAQGDGLLRGASGEDYRHADPVLRPFRVGDARFEARRAERVPAVSAVFAAEPCFGSYRGSLRAEGKQNI